MNQVTINFIECDTQPSKGYHLYWRKAGSGDELTDGGYFFTTPIVFTDDSNPDGTDYEGILVSEFSNQVCNDIPWSTLVQESSGSGPGSIPDDITQCLLGCLNPFAGTLNVIKNHTTGAINISGTIFCAGFGCPCNLNTGAVVGRTTPSSPCNPCEDTLSLFGGDWNYGQTGYLSYLGAPVVIPCEGLFVDINFVDPCWIEPV